MLFNFFRNILRREAHGGKIVCHVRGEFFLRCLHELDGGADGVVHVHHRERSIFGKETGIRAGFERLNVNVYGVIRRAAARYGFPTDEARITDRTHIDTIPFVVILAQHFTRIFRNAVHRRRFHDGVLRSVFAGGRRPESGDRAWPEYFEFLLDSEVQHLAQAVHVQIPAQFRIGFSCCGKKRGKKIYLRDSLFHDNSAGRFGVRRIKLKIRAGAGEQRILFANVAGKNVFAAVGLAECEGELDTYLPARADDENFFFVIHDI